MNEAFKTYPLTVSKTAVRSLTAFRKIKDDPLFDEDDLKPFKLDFFDDNLLFRNRANADFSLPIFVFDGKPIACFSQNNDNEYNLVMLSSLPEKVAAHLNKRIESLCKQMRVMKDIKKNATIDAINSVYDLLGAEHAKDYSTYHKKTKLSILDLMKASFLAEDPAPGILMNEEGISYDSGDGISALFDMNLPH